MYRLNKNDKQKTPASRKRQKAAKKSASTFHNACTYFFVFVQVYTVYISIIHTHNLGGNLYKLCSSSKVL